MPLLLWEGKTLLPTGACHQLLVLTSVACSAVKCKKVRRSCLPLPHCVYPHIRLHTYLLSIQLLNHESTLNWFCSVLVTLAVQHFPCELNMMLSQHY